MIRALLLILLGGMWGRECEAAGGVVTALLEAVVGRTEDYTVQQWRFDPEVAQRRSKEFQELNGPKSVLLIEKLGLGEDGRMRERLYMQRLRDARQGVSNQVYGD